MDERPIDFNLRVIDHSLLVVVDSLDPQLVRAFGPVPERGGRVLRVLYDPGREGALLWVVTALYVRIDESPVFESEEIRPGVMIDLDERGEIIGLEMLCVSQRLPTAELRHLEFDLL